MKLQIIVLSLMAINCIHAMDPDKSSLHKMIRRNQLTSEKQLNDLDINKRNRDGNTPLMIAVERERIEAIKLLLAAKAALDIRDQNGFTVLHHAARRGNPEIIELVLKANDQQKKIDVDCKNNFNETPLMIAVDRCHHQVAKMLIDARANIHKRYAMGEWLLYRASEHHSPETVRILLDAGADANQNWPGITALNVAGDDEVIRLLKEAGGKKGMPYCVIV